MEPCFFHPNKQAVKWREAMVLGEPARVPLCNGCIHDIREAELQDHITTYPLDLVIINGEEDPCFMGRGI
jgi:hypothetical protein